nr:hypothetical protein BgiMline_026127 [Biomphalaria glabrata]
MSLKWNVWGSVGKIVPQSTGRSGSLSSSLTSVSEVSSHLWLQAVVNMRQRPQHGIDTMQRVLFSQLSTIQRHVIKVRINKMQRVSVWQLSAI